MREKPINILLIEDDEEDYMITRDVIDEIPDRRYRLDWVSTFKEGIAAVEKNSHDVYLLDYRLGEENGIPLLQEVQAPSVESPFVLLTGMNDTDLDQEAMKAGASDFLVKGELSANVLERTIRYAIQQRQTIQQLKKREQALVKSEQLMNEAEALSHIGHYEWNITNNKIFWSNELFRIYGHEPQSFEVTLDKLFEQVHPDDQQMMKDFSQRVQKGKIPLNFGYRIIQPNQQVR